VSYSRFCSKGITDTVVFHFDPMNGEDILGISMRGNVLQGVDVFTGPLLDAYMWKSDKKIIILIDGSQLVYNIQPGSR
jgi:ER membrane protein complex subunit 1